MPVNTGEFAARVTSLRQRIDALELRLAAAEDKQGAFLARVAVVELEQQKDRLATYQVQARFALATMYDRAASAAAARRQAGSAGAEGRRAGAAIGRGAIGRGAIGRGAVGEAPWARRHRASRRRSRRARPPATPEPPR